MLHLVDPNHHATIEDYERVAHLSAGTRNMRFEAQSLRSALAGRKIWMVNSTARGGGVAEMLPALLALLRELGLDVHWMVMEPSEPRFFVLTKQLHNLIHGEGSPMISSTDRELYERVSRQTADEMASHVSPGDVVVVHDPQPAGAGAILREQMEIAAIWRCHIGLDRETAQTVSAWNFLERWLAPYDHSVFTAPEYIPRCLAGRATIIHPSIDPLSDKNRDLSVHALTGILVNGGLVPAHAPVVKEPFPELAQRLQPDGEWLPAVEPEDIGLLFRPIVTQVSRWDRLKGYLPLLHGFVGLKERALDRDGRDDDHQRALELSRLVLAGPDPASISDDPEGLGVLEEIRQAYAALDPEMQRSIAVISLPMGSRRHNALLVNALQRCSDIVVQNSLQEGFGLTVTEAMWKRAAILGSCAAGIRQQVRPGLDGVLVRDPCDADAIAEALDRMLASRRHRDSLGMSGQQRVHDDFLVFAQVSRWMKLLAQVVEKRWGNGHPPPVLGGS